MMTTIEDDEGKGLSENVENIEILSEGFGKTDPVSWLISTLEYTVKSLI